MRFHNSQEGQTLVETAVVLFLLLLVILGIAEFARAWYTKSSLKNAVRQGARVAVVTAKNVIPTSFFTCIKSTTCPISDKVMDAVCCSPGIPKEPENNTTVSVTCEPPPCSAITTGGTVIVSATSNFKLAVGSSFLPWLHNIQITTDASMMYEL